MRIHLRAGEKFFINGAVLKVDRRVSVELLNEANFLLEAHVIQPEDAATPLRQLYFALQTMLIEPDSKTAYSAYQRMLAAARGSFANPEVRGGLTSVAELVARERVFEALKVVRRLFTIEQSILTKSNEAPSHAA